MSQRNASALEKERDFFFTLNCFKGQSFYLCYLLATDLHSEKIRIHGMSLIIRIRGIFLILRDKEDLYL